MSRDNELLGPIVRAFRLVEALADSPRPLTGKEISDQQDLPPSTVHRLLQILSRIEIVERADDGQRYAPGPSLYRIAYATIRKSDLTERAQPFIQDVVNQLDITSMFWTLIRSKRLVIPTAKILSSHSLDFQETSFMPRGLAWGCVGRSVLAYLPEVIVAEVHAAAKLSPTGRRMESLRALKAGLAEIRADGYAFSSEQTIEQAVGFAAPVFDHRGEVIGCIGGTMPKLRYDPKDKVPMLETVRRGAQALSEALGCRP